MASAPHKDAMPSARRRAHRHPSDLLPRKAVEEGAPRGHCREGHPPAVPSKPGDPMAVPPEEQRHKVRTQVTDFVMKETVALEDRIAICR